MQIWMVMRITEVVCDKEEHTSGLGEVPQAGQEASERCGNGRQNAHWVVSGEAQEHDVER